VLLPPLAKANFHRFATDLSVRQISHMRSGRPIRLSSVAWADACLESFVFARRFFTQNREGHFWKLCSEARSKKWTPLFEKHER
jgi:hypothetical protein